MRHLFTALIAFGASLTIGGIALTLLFGALRVSDGIPSGVMAVGFVIVFAGVIMRTVLDNRAERRERASSGPARLMLAKVLNARVTSSSANPFCELDLIVDAPDRGLYRTQVREQINLARLPGLQPGAIVVVSQPDPTRPVVTVVDPAPVDWQQRIDQDTRLRAVHDATPWTVEPPAKNPSAQVAKAVGIALAVGALVWYDWQPLSLLVQGNSTEEIRDEMTNSWNARRSVFAPADLEAALQGISAQAGTTHFSDVTVHQTSVSANAVAQPGADRVTSYTWANGEIANEIDMPAMHTDEDVSTFDVTTLDWSLIQQLVDQVPELTGVTQPDPYFILTPAMNSTGVEVTMYVSAESIDATVVTDGTGLVLAMTGGAPGSPAAQWSGAEQ